MLVNLNTLKHDYFGKASNERILGFDGDGGV